MGPELIVATILAGSGMILMTPVLIVRMILKHREKLHAMRYRQEGAPGLIEEITALREEVSQLRETTGKFDMSFDAALERLNERVGTLEAARRAAPTASEQTTTPLRRS